jgi:hypothetical protein
MKCQPVKSTSLHLFEALRPEVYFYGTEKCISSHKKTMCLNYEDQQVNAVWENPLFRE